MFNIVFNFSLIIKELIHSRFLNANGKNTIMDTIHKVLLEVYDLVSTTISGIPMKVINLIFFSENFRKKLNKDNLLIMMWNCCI